MGIRDQDLDAGLFEAFHVRRDESALQAIQRLHGAGSSLLLQEASEDVTPVLLRRNADPVQDDPRYRVLGEIARGGIGIVYKAHDNDLNRDVALKVLRREHAARDDVIQRFVEEAQVGGQLQHPGIVPVYGLGLQPDGRPSFVMKLVKGRTLAELLADPPANIDLLAVFEQVAQTVAYAHSRGVIHRDLKPANVMVGAFGEVQVVDWGFAKVLACDDVQPAVEPAPSQTVVTTVRTGGEGSHSVAGSVMGTPAYMPPEQAMGRIDELDERSDVFALGAILCEVLTGRPPYTGEAQDQLIAATQCRLEPARERLASADAPEELVAIARDCLQPLAGDRPRDAGVLADRLAAHFASVEERARQAQLDAVAAEAKVAHERYRRRRAVVLAAAAMVAIAACGGGYLWWRADQEARFAEVAPEIAEALRRATRHEGEQDWAPAADAAGDAVAYATSAGVDTGGAAEMLARFEEQERAAAEEATQRAADNALLDELEEIRLRRSDEFSDKEADAAFTAAIGSRWPDQAVDTDRLRRSPDALAFAAVFDAWAVMLRSSRSLQGRDWQAIDRIARAIDPEHDELRDALVADDPAGLVGFAASPETLELPPALLTAMSAALRRAGCDEAADALLGHAFLRHPEDSWTHDRLARTANARGQYDRAVRHYRAAIALRPDSTELRHRLGKVLDRRGDHEGAIAVWREVRRRNPAWTHGYWHIAESLRMLGRAVEIEGVYREASEASPDDPEVLHSYGVFLSNVREQHREAIDVFRRSLQHEDNARTRINLAVALMQDGQADEAVHECRRAIARSPTPAEAADAHALIGTLLDGQNQHAKAIEEYKLALGHLPWHADAVASLANALDRLGRAEDSIEWCDRAIAARPDLGSLYEHRANMRRVLEDGEGALADYRAALARGVDTAHLRKGMGTVFCDQLHLYDHAIEQFRLGIDRNGEDPQLYLNLGIANRRKGEYAEAERWLDEAIARMPTYGQARYERGQVRLRMSNLEGALADLQQALRLGYKPFYVHSDIGLIRLDKGKVPQALEHFEKSLQAAPSSVRRADLAKVRANLGLAKQRAGDLDGALEDLLAAIELDDQSARSHCLLARVQLDRKEFKGAIETYQRARQLDATVADAYPEFAQFAGDIGRLPAILAGDDEPDGWREAYVFANLALFLHVDHAGAVRLYRSALAANPELEGIDAWVRYNAACAAALAGPESHAQALAWLRTQLADEARRVEQQPGEVATNLAHWLQDPDLAPIRDGDELDDELGSLWADVERLRKRAEAKR